MRRRTLRQRLAVGAALTAGLVLTTAAPVFAHATFPAGQNPSGSAAVPYDSGRAVYLTVRVPEERSGPPKLDNVDVKIDVPAAWTGVTCGDVFSASGSAPGAVAANWSCAIEPGTPTVVHYQRVGGATDLGVYFTFSAVTGAAGTSPVVVHQTYSQTGEVVDWKDQATPPGCTTGTNSAGTACSLPAPVRVVGTPAPKGYWLVAADGGIFAFGDATFFGSTGALTLNSPIVGMASTPTGKGYWLVAADGGIFAFGDATFFGSTGALTLNSPIVGMASTPTGKGYWLVAADGGIFAFGDATFFGSTGALTLNSPIVGMASTPGGRGYRFVAVDGGIFSFGDAGFYGSAGGESLTSPIAAVDSTPSGRGYRLIAEDGTIRNFGDATALGTAAISGAVGATATPTASGLWIANQSGEVRTIGDAEAIGATLILNQPIVGIAAVG